MMRLEYQILIAVMLDLILGDPRWFPHPVKFIGNFALGIEGPLRKSVSNERLAGVIAAILVVGTTGILAAALISLCYKIHPALGDSFSIFLIYTGIAATDMATHSLNVYKSLVGDTIDQARQRVGMICGRDTDRLNETEISRATVESVAENMVDGVTAPLFFAALAGPVGIMVYKAISTLDSTFGYKNERYLRFGWASARLDDIVNFVPSRFTALLVPAAAAILKLRPVNSFRVFLNDRHKHPSPNAAQAEAAVAGALGVQLGGLSYYFGKPSEKPTLGYPHEPISPDHILTANSLLFVTSALVLLVLLTGRFLITG